MEATTSLTPFRQGLRNFFKLAEDTFCQWNCLQKMNVDFSKLDGCVKTTKNYLDDMQRVLLEMERLRQLMCPSEENATHFEPTNETCSQDENVTQTIVKDYKILDETSGNDKIAN